MTLPGVARLAAIVWLLSPGSGLAGSPVLDAVVENRFFQADGKWPGIRLRTAEPVELHVIVMPWGGGAPVAWRHSPGAVMEWEASVGEIPLHPSVFYVAALGKNGEVSVYPEEPGGGELVRLRESKIDREQQRVSYGLQRAACVRLRAGLKDGLCLATLQPWTPLGAGRHHVSWDGTCASLKGLYDHPELRMTSVAFALPAHALMPKTPSRPMNWSPAPLVPAGEIPAAVVEACRLRHAKWLEQCRDSGLARIQPDYRLMLETAKTVDTGSIEVRLTCPPEERGRLLNRRFEIMLFLDTVFLCEDERADVPFTYPLSTDGVGPGQHMVTVNIVDTDGRLGIAHGRFDVDEQQDHRVRPHGE